VEHVVADIDASRGLDEAEIVSAHAASRAKAGHTVKVRLLVRVYRGKLRTVSFPLRIPQSARGAIVVTIRGPSTPETASTSDLSSSLEVALSGSGSGESQPGESSPAMSSLTDLRHAIAAIPSYDGLIASFPGGHRHRVFRDPSLLITGRTTVALMVGKP
jgi:hypothetical protein